MVATDTTTKDQLQRAWQDVNVAEGDWNLAFDALDLSVPAPCVNVELMDDGFVKCTVSDPHALQQRANRFRKGYKQWRQHKPRGARGEVTRIEEVDESQPPPVITTPRTEPIYSRVRSHTLSPKAKLPGSKSFTQLTDAEAAVEENWLKFYLNPYANLIDETLVLQPMSLRQQNLEVISRNFKMVRGRTPTYDRSADKYLRICHVGVGGFHRSHQAVYTDDLLELHNDRPECPRWGICGIGLMPWDRKMFEVLQAQDHLYTVLFRSQEGNDARVVGSLLDFKFAPDDYEGLLKTLVGSDTRIVSLTITEKGYCQRVDGSLDTDDPNIKWDLKNLTQPRTAIGMITAALDARRLMGGPSFTVLSCDNVADNGHQLRSLVLQMAELAVGKNLREWIEANTTFPNSMVDRITPATEDVHREILQQDFGVCDEWPVVAEHYGQWIIEDQFVNGERPRWEDVGVMFVPDVKPYEYMKLRLLNGGHSALAYVSFLAGYQFVDDAMNNDEIVDFLQSFMDESGLSVPPVPGVDLDAYKRNLIQRFSNPYVKDKIERLMLDGSKKLPNTMRDPIDILTKRGEATTYLAVAVAAYIRYVSGVDDQGNDFPFPVLDPLADKLKEPALRACRFEPTPCTNGDAFSDAGTPAYKALRGGDAAYDPRGVLEIVFGPENAANMSFVRNVSTALSMICEKGIVHCLLNTR